MVTMSTSTKTEYLQIRVTLAQKKQIKRAARLAGVPVSTWILSKILNDKTTVFQGYLAQLAQHDHQKLVFAALNDFLSNLPSPEFTLALSPPPQAGLLSPYAANYVAAMIELAAHHKGVLPPLWVNNIKPLDEPHFGTPLLNLRLYLLTHSPPPFRKRNIFIDASVGDRV